MEFDAPSFFNDLTAKLHKDFSEHASLQRLNNILQLHKQ